MKLRSGLSLMALLAILSGFGWFHWQSCNNNIEYVPEEPLEDSNLRRLVAQCDRQGRVGICDHGGSVTSALNNLSISMDCAQASEFTFWAMGHIYGSPEEKSWFAKSIWPTASLLAKTYELSRSGSCFIAALGDTVYLPRPWYAPPLRQWAAGLQIPVFNAVGNHDYRLFTRLGKADPPFEQPRYFAFSIRNTKFIFMHGEYPKVGNIEKDQIAWLEGQLNDRTVRSVIIMCHRIFWAEYFAAAGVSKFASLFANGNTRTDYGQYVWDPIAPILRSASARFSSLVVMSGDIGIMRSLPVFYGEHEGITYVATGLGTPEDVIVHTKVASQTGNVQFTVVPLDGALKSFPIEYYNSTLWERYFALSAKTRHLHRGLIMFENGQMAKPPKTKKKKLTKLTKPPIQGNKKSNSTKISRKKKAKIIKS